MSVALVWGGLVLAKGALVLLLAEAAARLCRRADRRHLVRALSLLALLGLPVLQATLPALAIPLLPAATEVVDPGGPVAPPVARATLPAPGDRPPGEVERPGGARQGRDFSFVAGLLVIIVYGAGVSWSGAWLLAGHLRLRAWRRSCAPFSAGMQAVLDDLCPEAGVRHGVGGLIGDRCLVPCTIGLFRPLILLPAAATRWSSRRLRSVLLHELAHVRRKDAAWHALAEAARTVYWFHPWVRRSVRLMRGEAERACDASVVAAGVVRSIYARDLLSVAAQISGEEQQAIPAMASRSLLAERVEAVLDGREPLPPAARQPSRTSLLVGLVGFLCLPLAAVQPVEALLHAGPQAPPLQARWFRPGLDVAAFVQGPLGLQQGAESGAGFVLLFEALDTGAARSMLLWSPGNGNQRRMFRAGEGALPWSAARPEEERWIHGNLAEVAARLPGDSGIEWPQWLIPRHRGGGGSTISGLPGLSRHPGLGPVQAGWMRAGKKRAGAFASRRLACTPDELDGPSPDLSWCLGDAAVLALFEHDAGGGVLRVAEIRRNGRRLDILLSVNGVDATTDATWTTWMETMLNDLPPDFFRGDTLEDS